MMGLENFGAIVKMSVGWWGLGKGRKELRWVDCTIKRGARSRSNNAHHRLLAEQGQPQEGVT